MKGKRSKYLSFEVGRYSLVCVNVDTQEMDF